MNYFNDNLYLCRRLPFCIMKKKTLLSTILLCAVMSMMAQQPFASGTLKITKVARNAIRVRYTTDKTKGGDLPYWLYVKHDEVKKQDIP